MLVKYEIGDNKYEWDSKKNNTNKFKHKVTFEEAATVFLDDDAVTLYDEKHSDSEERFTIIGLSWGLMELAVCHCFRGENGDTVRIISAREADNSEKTIYERGY